MTCGVRGRRACPRTRRKGPTARTATAPTAAQRSQAHSRLLPQRTYDQNAQSVVNAPPHIVCGFF